MTTLSAIGVRIPHRALGAGAPTLPRPAGRARALPPRRPGRHRPRLAASDVADGRGGLRPRDPDGLREVPNTHTAFAYARVAEETAMLGLEPLAGHSHTPDPISLEGPRSRSTRRSDMLAVPSEYARTNRSSRTQRRKRTARPPPLRVRPRALPRPPAAGRSTWTTASARSSSAAASRARGLHYALQAWLDSERRRAGNLHDLRRLLPGLRPRARALARAPERPGERLRPDDVGALMRASDVLVLPSIEDGSALVTYEAQGSGCVLRRLGRRGRPLRAHALDASSTRQATSRPSPRPTFASSTAIAASRLTRLRARTLESRDQLTWDQGVRDLETIYAGLVSRRAET